MEYIKQNYKNALGIFSEYLNNRYDVDFSGYCETRIKELEKPEIPMYKCIQLPPANNGMFEIGILYSEKYYFLGFNLSDLPKHFELVEPEPEPEPEKITWHEVVTLIEGFKRKTHLPQGFYIELMKIINRIKTDYL